MSFCMIMSRKEVLEITIELFLVSVIYWISILVVFIWLNRRLSYLTGRIADLEQVREKK